MYAVNVLPTQLFGFECKKVDEIRAALKDEPFNTRMNGKTSHSKNSYLHKKHPMLGEFIQLCNDEMWNHIKNKEDDTRLVTTQCWMSNAIKGEQHNCHNHPNSVASGILYLTTNKAVTLFERKNQYKLGCVMSDEYSNCYDYYSVDCVAGHTVMFPSPLKHLVPENSEDETRLTISWNTFLDGSIAPESCLSQLRVKVL